MPLERRASPLDRLGRIEADHVAIERERALELGHAEHHEREGLRGAHRYLRWAAWLTGRVGA